MEDEKERTKGGREERRGERENESFLMSLPTRALIPLMKVL